MVKKPPVFRVLLLLLELASCIDVGTPGKKSVRCLFSIAAPIASRELMQET